MTDRKPTLAKPAARQLTSDRALARRRATLSTTVSPSSSPATRPQVRPVVTAKDSQLAAAPSRDASRNELEQMVELLTRQSELYSQLAELSQQQEQQIEQGNAEQLLALLGRKQAVIDSVTMINDMLRPLRDRWQGVAERADPQDRQRVNELAQCVQEQVEAIIEQDRVAEQRLAHTKQTLGEEIAQTGQAGVAMNAYRKAGPPPSSARQASGPIDPRFTDQQG